MKPFKLTLEINQSQLPTEAVDSLAKSGMLLTPPLDEHFWLYRVAVSEKQAIVGFPKFGVVGVGFQHEEDWNTNLPSSADAAELYEHISHNRKAGGDCPPKQRCLDAIRLIQQATMTQSRAEAVKALDKPGITDAERLAVLSRFLRHTGSYMVAQTFDVPAGRRVNYP